ncbi:MAG: hypothetical protein J7L45_01330 [Candidatus Aenigmarchaeota archaeon]|nr:hypothetical protein [Candidatus Aenigmarchaeota archaeon]
MKKSSEIILILVIGVLILSEISIAAQVAKLRVWVLGDVGVALDAPSTIVVPLGGKNGTIITVKNVGNVDDIIKLEGSLDPRTDWIKFSFRCTQTVGQCDDYPSSKLHTVKNMKITPQTRETQIYLEVEGYKKGVSTDVDIWGYSMTKYKKDDLKKIKIIVKGTGQGGVRELPGLSILSLPLLLFISGFTFYKKVA